MSPIYGIWNVAAFIYDMSPLRGLRHLSSLTLSKDEVFNDLQMNHSGRIVRGARHPHPTSPPPLKKKRKTKREIVPFTVRACFLSVLKYRKWEGEGGTFVWDWKIHHRIRGREPRRTAVSQCSRLTMTLPPPQFTCFSLWFYGSNNSYFHLHDCINYSITHVSLRC